VSGAEQVSENHISDMKNYHFVKCILRPILWTSQVRLHRMGDDRMLDRPMIDPRELRNAFGVLPTGVTVVSLNDEAGGPTGVTVGSFTSLSMDPPLCLFSLGKTQASARLFKEGVPFVVNVLPHAQADVAWQFAKSLEDKCAGIPLSDTMVAAPRLRDGLAHFACHTHAIHDGGDHIIVIGAIADFDYSDGDALVFYRGGMHRPAPV
jgi:flavin reductase (DIM6/NTAB) family NADH-FMN oxidoreductase RutF